MTRLSVMFSIVALFVLMTTSANAHPPVSVVEDRQGHVYFSDLKQVWKVSTDGKKTVAVPNVHTHELLIDAQGGLVGEHLWYEGEALDSWKHRVWRLNPDDQKLKDMISASDPFAAVRQFSFVQDRAGNMYWGDDTQKPVTIKKRSPDGKITTYSPGPFQSSHWMTFSPDGTLFLVDQGNLIAVDSRGQMRVVAAKLSEKDPDQAPLGVKFRHYHMGLWTDSQNQVYVAVHSEKVVLKVDAKSGKRSVATRSTGRWFPCGGLVDSRGRLWVLEISSANVMRVRRVDLSGQTADQTF